MKFHINDYSIILLAGYALEILCYSTSDCIRGSELPVQSADECCLGEGLCIDSPTFEQSLPCVGKSQISALRNNHDNDYLRCCC